MHVSMKDEIKEKFQVKYACFMHLPFFLTELVYHGLLNLTATKLISD